MWLLQGTTPNQLVTIPPGVKGTRAVLSIMERLANQGARDVKVRAQAIEILRQSRAAAHDTLAELRAIFEWVRDHVRYTRDVVNLETLQTPDRTLAWRAGDCDDMSTLIVALARSVGLPARFSFRSIATGPARRGYSHVYAVARVGPHVVAMDPIYQGTPFGWEYPTPTLRGEHPLWAT